MKLVTLFKKSMKMPPEYVPGKCNIGARGRAIRLATGLGIIAVFVGIDALALGSMFAPFSASTVRTFLRRLADSSIGNDVVLCTSCLQGTYDLHEPIGMAIGRSETKWRCGLTSGRGWTGGRLG
ncbi:MAG TPA: hypothetical protein VGS11_13230 [Candidatus Bathyarchaeia archaeon]|nr:hypothetical protein [Candidatus Bathyarchaeia archaeon]